MEPIPNYTFNFNKIPSLNYINKKYFIEWITVDENQMKYILNTKDFDSFEEARDYLHASKEEGIGWLYRNRRFKCLIK